MGKVFVLMNAIHVDGFPSVKRAAVVLLDTSLRQGQGTSIAALSIMMVLFLFARDTAQLEPMPRYRTGLQP